MTNGIGPRQFAILRRTVEAGAAYIGADAPTRVKQLVIDALGADDFAVELHKAMHVVGLPSLNWHIPPQGAAAKKHPADDRTGTLGGPKGELPIQVTQLAVAMSFDDEDVASRFWREVKTVIARGGATVFVSIGADLAIGGADYWCPNGTDHPLFRNRTAAGQLINIEFLRQQGLTGQDVNVAIIDQGLDERLIPANFAGGWARGSQLPGETQGKAGAHGAMVARNVLDGAPSSAIWDLPLIPSRIEDISSFVSDAWAGFRLLIDDIATRRANGSNTGPWVLSNAWAVFDRRSESPPGSYTTDPEHPFNLIVAEAVDAGHDVVFAAGNCGAFCPDVRCGRQDRGPGQSIYGANSHKRVLTTGAVRVDGRWSGYSSQGNGQPRLSPWKPDLCAPSDFAEDDDAFLGNSGTSAACAITAGIVAALRGKWGPAEIPPDMLRLLLTVTAQKTEGPEWNDRLGFGILDAEAAYGGAATAVP
jgi:subtilisin family serine protease